MLAEAEQIDHLNYAFDMNYGWELHHIMNKIAQGEMNVDNLTEYLEKYNTQYGSDAYRMNFTTNHDENSWNGTLNERMGDAQYAMAGLMATLPGMPLIYSGQETGLDKRLKFFEKDTIEWKEGEFRSFYTTLLQQKKINKALWNGEAGGSLNILKSNKPSEVFAYSREKEGDQVIAVFNFSSETTAFSFSNPHNIDGLTDLYNKDGEVQLASKTITLDPWAFIILTSKK
jgi:1,4-alpha-glucan branching enzyme